MRNLLLQFGLEKSLHLGLTFTHASLTQIFSLTFERDRAILNWSSYAWHDSAFEVAFNIRNQIFDLGIVWYGMVRHGTAWYESCEEGWHWNSKPCFRF